MNNDFREELTNDYFKSFIDPSKEEIENSKKQVEEDFKEYTSLIDDEVKKALETINASIYKK